MKDKPNIAELFAAALELDASARVGFLADGCGGDHALLDELSQLIDEHERLAESQFLEISALEIEAEHLAEDAGEDQRIGQTFGRYKITNGLAAGGMGAIYLAVRTDDFEKQAAVKIIKRGMDTDAILGRFRTERQILAGLDHPNIAHLIDGGTTDDGLPYFVMEFVDGVPVVEYCQKNSLSAPAVLHLFRKICAAVQFAHQKLIVHRDLKPSNILVNADGEPKLLDFGIAKLLNLTDPSQTQTNMRVLTPAYASPEQLRGEITGTASDVYSLGLILSEMLGGTRNTTAGDETRHHDLDEIKGDLRNIIATSLRDEPAKRYGTVEAFSEDIRRYLNDLPVLARPDSLAYRTQKFLRRHRVAAAFCLLLGLSLIGGLAATVWKANEAHRQHEISEKRFGDLRKLSASFIKEIHGAIQDLPGSLPARQLLLKRAAEQLDMLAGETDGDPALQDELATAYINLASLPDMALSEKETIYEKAIAIYRTLMLKYPDDLHYQEQTAIALIELADTVKVRGSVAKGLETTRNAVTILEAVNAAAPHNAEHVRNLRNGYSALATFYVLDGERNENLKTSLRAKDTDAELRSLDTGGDWDLHSSRAYLQIGIAQTDLGDLRSASENIRNALDGFLQYQARDPNNMAINYAVWSAERRYAVALDLSGSRSDAIVHAGRALALIESMLSTSPKDIGYHRNSAVTHIILGQMLVREKQPAAAIPHFRRALELSRQVLAIDADYIESKIDVARSLGNLGNALVATGRKADGQAYLDEALTTFHETASADPENSLMMRDFAETAEWLGLARQASDPASAAEYFRISYALWNDLRSRDRISEADSARPDLARNRTPA